MFILLKYMYVIAQLLTYLHKQTKSLYILQRFVFGKSGPLPLTIFNNG